MGFQCQLSNVTLFWQIHNKRSHAGSSSGAMRAEVEQNTAWRERERLILCYKFGISVPINKSGSRTWKIAVYFVKGSWKFTRQHVMNTIWDRSGVKLEGTMPDRILNFFIRWGCWQRTHSGGTGICRFAGAWAWCASWAPWRSSAWCHTPCTSSGTSPPRRRA